MWKTIKKIDHGSYPGDIQIVRYRPSLFERIRGLLRRPTDRRRWTFEVLTPNGWVEYYEFERWDNLYRRKNIQHPRIDEMQFFIDSVYKDWAAR